MNRATMASSAGEPGAGGGSGTPRRRLAALHARTGSLERAVDRLDGRVEHARHLTGVEPENVAQDEHRELAGRQHLQGGHEGEGDGFRLLVAGLGAGRQGGPCHLGEQGIGVRLEPDGLAEPGRLRRLDPRNVPLPGRAAGSRCAVRSGTGWWRSCTARCAARSAPRTRRGPARRRAACPARRPRRPAACRASGSSAPAAPCGAARSAHGTRRRHRNAPVRSSRQPPASP